MEIIITTPVVRHRNSIVHLQETITETKNETYLEVGYKIPTTASRLEAVCLVLVCPMQTKIIARTVTIKYSSQIIPTVLKTQTALDLNIEWRKNFCINIATVSDKKVTEPFIDSGVTHNFLYSKSSFV